MHDHDQVPDDVSLPADEVWWSYLADMLNEAEDDARAAEGLPPLRGDARWQVMGP